MKSTKRINWASHSTITKFAMGSQILRGESFFSDLTRVTLRKNVMIIRVRVIFTKSPNISLTNNVSLHTTK